MTHRARRFGARLLVFMSVLCPGAAMAQPNVALVIGNASYKEVPLRNPLNDAQDMAQSLRELGFEVIEARDVSRRAMLEAFNAFGDRLQQAKVGLFYYSGHGVQRQGANYLIPLQTTISDPADLEQEGVDVLRILGRMDRSQTMLNIVILDACRNNPFRNLLGFRSLGERGLTITPRVRSSLIAYATQPDNVAEDGAGRNGTYTKHLLRYIKQPGLSLPDLFSEVGRAVLQETGNRQEPWVSFSPLPRFCLAGCGPASVAGATPQANPPSTPAPVPQASLPSTPTPATQASLPPVPETQIGASARKRPDINGVSIQLDQLAVQVFNPPPEDALILVNGKNVTALVRVDEKVTQSMALYILQGSPEQLNLSVGQNKVVVRYGDTATPPYDFKCTVAQREEAQRWFDQQQRSRNPPGAFDQQQPSRNSPGWLDQLLRPRAR